MYKLVNNGIRSTASQERRDLLTYQYTNKTKTRLLRLFNTFLSCNPNFMHDMLRKCKTVQLRKLQTDTFSVSHYLFPVGVQQVPIDSIYPQLSGVRFSSEIHLTVKALSKMSVLNIVADAMTFFVGDQITSHLGYNLSLCACMSVCERVRGCVCNWWHTTRAI